MHYTINHEQRFIVAEATAGFDYQELVSDESDIERAPDYVREYARVFDFSNVVAQGMQTGQLLELVRTTRAFDVDDYARIALVGKHPDTVRLLRLFASHFNEQPVRVFDERDRALAWVMTPSSSTFEETEFNALRFRGLVTLEQVISDCQQALAESDVLLVDLRQAAASPASMYTGSEVDTAKGYIAFAVNSHFMSMLGSRVIDLLGVQGGVFRSMSDAIAVLEAREKRSER